MNTVVGCAPAALSLIASRMHQRSIFGVGEMNPVIQDILERMALAGFTDKEQFAVRLSLEEAIVNAVKHGNDNDPRKQVTVTSEVTPRECSLRIEDEGPGFNPERIPDPLAPENLEQPGGRGVFLMRHYMTRVSFNERGNVVMLVKVRGA
jgi:serine/threonine-protein kinase RsbW